MMMEKTRKETGRRRGEWFMMLRLVRNPSPNQPFIFYIDGRTLEYGRENFCLITGFRFNKVNLDPKEEDHSELRKRVFPKIGNLKGEHLLALVNKDVKFNKLDDEDDVRVCLLLALDFVFMGQKLRHVITNPIVNLVDDFYKWDAFPWGEYMWSFFHKRDYNVVADRRKYHLDKLASNPKYEANYVLYGFVFPFKVRYEVHARTEVSRVVDKEEVHVRVVNKEDVRTRAVDEEDMQERDVLAKTVKAQEHMIVDLQRRLFLLEEITKQLKIGPSDGPSDVDHLDKVILTIDPRMFLLVSIEGVSQCMNVDEPYKNWNDVSDNFHVDGLDHQSVEGVSQCTRLNDEYESVAINGLISLRSQDIGNISKVRELINDIFDTPSIGPILFSVVKDADENDVKIVEVPLSRHKFPSKACLSPYMQPPLTEVNCRKRRHEIKLKSVSKRVIKTVFGSDGNEIQLLSWKEDLTRSPTAPKKQGPSWWNRNPSFFASVEAKLEFQIPLYLDNAEVFEKKNIDKLSYSISFRYADGVPLQGDLYGDCGLWVCIFLYRLSHNLPLEFDDPISVALAYRERNGYSQKDKNKAKTDKTKHGIGKSMKSRSQKTCAS
ncbi:phospholipase-like protein [Tanacetum coccineum]